MKTLAAAIITLLVVAAVAVSVNMEPEEEY